MPTVTNPEHRLIGASARKAWNRVKVRAPATDYTLAVVGGNRLIAWTHISAPTAVLHTMQVKLVGGLPQVTYMQVSKAGEAVRSMTRAASVAELERWFQHYPADRKLMHSKKKELAA